MQLRKLKKKDTPLMLEWMHDPAVVRYMQADFANKTIEDCYKFIDYSLSSIEDLHLAITDDGDEYMGTVSLKHITKESAEFAITVRACAMGKGYAQFGMAEILNIGFSKLNLSEIYWCVNPENERAVRFYEKNGYKRADFFSLNTDTQRKIENTYYKRELMNLVWFQKKTFAIKTRKNNDINTNADIQR